MNPNTDVTGDGSSIYDGTISRGHSAAQKAGERDGDRFGASLSLSPWSVGRSDRRESRGYNFLLPNDVR